MQEPLLIEPFVEAPLGVLLVEDNPADARLVEEELRDQDELSLVWVRSLEEAREALTARRYDAVLLDLLLPDARGVDLIDGMRGVAGDAALVVLSGQSPDDLLLARAAIRKGAEDFLPKGARAPHLLPRMIATAVERRRRATAAPAPPPPVPTAAGDAAWCYDLQSGAVELSPTARRLLHLETEATGLPLATLLAALPGPARRAALRLWCRLRAGAHKVTTILFDNASPRPGAAAQDTLLEARARRDAEGRIVLVEGVLLDVTGARRIDRLHDAIINQLGHELRTPLTTIRAALGLLHGDVGEPLPHGSAGLLGRAVQNADRLAQILDDLLDPERAGATSRHRRRPARQVDLAALSRLLTNALDAWRPRAAAAGVSLLWRAAPMEEPCAQDELCDVAFVLDAILADAVRRALPAGQIEVGLEPRDGWLWLTMTITPAAIDAAMISQDGKGMASGRNLCCCTLDDRRLALIERLIAEVGGRLVETPEAAGGAWRIALPTVARP